VAGWAVQQGDWVHLNLPMEAEYAERCFIIETADKQIRSALGPHDANTILQNEGGKIIFEDTRQDREILFPALITRAELEDLKKALGPVNASAQLQQKPTPATGTKINPDHFKLYDYNIHKSLFEQRGKTIISVDPASTANINADYSVIQVWRMIYSKDGDKNSFYLIDQIRQKEGIKATLQYIVRMLQRYPGLKDVVVEKASGGFAILEFLREGLSKEALATIHDFSPATDKISRVEAISAWIEEGYVYIPDPKGAPFNVFDFVDEVRTFPLGKHDDQVDSLSQAILFVNLNNADKPIAHIQMLSKAWKFY
jgi:predicted phage terminase large subunit-like protein